MILGLKRESGFQPWLFRGFGMGTPELARGGPPSPTLQLPIGRYSLELTPASKLARSAPGCLRHCAVWPAGIQPARQPFRPSSWRGGGHASQPVMHAGDGQPADFYINLHVLF